MNPSDEREPAIYGQATVIVIDDDPEIRDQLAALFAEAGMAVRCFAAAEDFLAAYSPVQCACAVVDMALAGMDGMQLLAALAEREILLPVIFLTGYGDVDSLILETMQAGQDALVLDLFCQREQTVDEIDRGFKEGDKPFLFDHHESTFKRYGNRKWAVIDTKHCGAMVYWNWLMAQDMAVPDIFPAEIGEDIGCRYR